jgi:ABC-type transport system substrate-binding protein
MLQTGEVVASAPALKDWPALTEAGMKPLSASGFDAYTNIAFSGNWWEKNSARTGEPLVRDRDTSKPWIGDPFENGDTYDENTPSMQNSLKVRLALAQAIDREGLNDSILAGLGQPAYFGYQPAYESEYFKKGTFPDGWEYPYDLDLARQMLDEAGYGEGFQMDFWVGPSGLAPELMEAIAGLWQAELNIQVNLQRTTYETFRPSLVQRSVSAPFTGCGDGSSGNNPIDAARGFTMSSWSDGGFGVGMELPFAAENYETTALNPDAQARIDSNLEFMQSSIDWGFCVGIVSQPGYGLYNPDVIAEWRVLPVSNGGMNNMNNFESIVLK